ncbi:hypothetical protein Q9L58_010726, partial [Maublancomyces gigas]
DGKQGSGMVLSIAGRRKSTTALKGLLLFRRGFKCTLYICFDASTQCTSCLGDRHHLLRCTSTPTCAICAGPTPHTSTHAAALSANKRAHPVFTTRCSAATADPLPTKATPLNAPPKPRPLPLPLPGNNQLSQRTLLLPPAYKATPKIERGSGGMILSHGQVQVALNDSMVNGDIQQSLAWFS